jgi:endoglucanase
MNKITLPFLAILMIAGVLFTSCGKKPVVFDHYVSHMAPAEPQPFNDITSSELVAQIKLGWNMGNTLDASGLSWLPPTAAPVQLETAWGNPVTTPEIIQTVKNAGFNTIRIPVSWTKAADNNYVIRSNWMDRVTQIVNYAFDNGMYVIINTHHDEDVFKFTAAEKEESLKAFRLVWEQIAWNFRNYSEKLIFEGLNEPRTKGSPGEWQGGNYNEHVILTEHYKVFIETVRKTGGNNGKRIIMINPYAASTSRVAISGFVIPPDTVPDKIIVSVHNYAPFDFALNVRSPRNMWSEDNRNDTTPITEPLDLVYDKFVSKGIPVVMGEFGAMNKDNEDARAAWGEFYVRYARSKGIPCIWWDNGAFEGDGELFGLINRRNNTIAYPVLLAALNHAAYE